MKNKNKILLSGITATFILFTAVAFAGSQTWDDATESGDIYRKTGNVGIGTDEPEEAIHVVGVADITGIARVGSETITTLEACSTEGLVKYENDQFYGCTKDGWVILNH